MSVFRSYFLKNNTLIEGTEINVSQNPVTEISYGTPNEEVTRFIFDIDFSNLKRRIAEGFINPDKIQKHFLHITNTIAYAPEYRGKRSYSLEIERASSFELDLYNIDEDWDEGSGYEFVYDDDLATRLPQQASNWDRKKTDEYWSQSASSYVSGVNQVLATQRFETGDEDILIDVTDYVNQRLGLTGYTGYTGTSFGLGLKFPDNYESGATFYRQAVGFHVKHTHTFYEPFIETTFDDAIEDDRNYFYLGKDNELFIYVNVGGEPQNITVNSVEIYDYENNLIETITGDSITHVSKGVYKLTLNIDPADYPDAVIFRDKWNVTTNGRDITYEDQFYLIGADEYFTFNQSNDIDMDNYYFYFWGIKQQQNIRSGDIKKIKLTVKELYPNQDQFVPLDLEYRLYTTVGDKYELDVIPFTPVNRTSRGYEFNLDTSWLIPQDYYLQIRMKNGSYYEDKQSLQFTVVSDGIKNI